MSSNFFNIDIIRKKSLIKTNKIYQNSNKKSLEKERDINKFKNYSTIKNNTKELNVFKDKKYLVNIENVCEKSLFLLEMLKKQTEKNIFEKYDIQNFISLENNTKNIINLNNNELINNVSMKKKFLTTPLHISSIIK
ncbi:MAG: hypothetical protein OW720_03020 [Buchnera aphidicola (Brevicoryne brassicae)]|uniref:Uncharacterized protein n=1 Tax=Buchnera aphidicola (Brevicoryne brassicae) TaxID=911343 RepID=A0AAJ5PVK1_9GAMM|nr:hypothetical protein [Buchnera aphidicola]QCI20119.1 hypothetical protein D9V66_02995 [Buchnera aphidicola (Brevicoryne brassicae)]WAI18943.1 MAG: hypothetical protein OW720_03020 [Buchnera aphidicola (Brevicoryne brassicae)]